MRHLRWLIMVVIPVMAAACFSAPPVRADANEMKRPNLRNPAVREKVKDCLTRAIQASGVSDQQKSKLKSIQQDFRVKAEELKKSTLPQEEKRAKMRSLVKSMREDMMNVLTPAQQEKIKKWMKENCHPRKGAGKAPRPAK